ncbi:carboxypeptidase regulatory-like domain-containing protein [Myxococcus landrumensis]|uniref:Carboxypeptidase regulatory-like domain-containing protein n=1 Tax=Myxococcus landrumensis TaxID=2813577 RepID=A0ABX7NAC5_9BACT|nr:carboxypeptidase regulatory-like domain-containing protein [Myxococcus landrumus]QSQ15717.1 carboxypeptidase regulatory-like domain-containing protein [Myxococcus landrumus]
MSDESSNKSFRLYGVPESIQPRKEDVERLELIIDQEPDLASRARKMKDVALSIFTDPSVATAFSKDPRAYLEQQGLPEVRAEWDSMEVSLGRAMGDGELQALAKAGDVEGFLGRLKTLGFLPPTMEVSLNRMESLGFSGCVGVWLCAVLLVAVSTVVAVQAYAAVWAVALLAAFVKAAVSLDTWVDGPSPGGDNPDENEEAASGLPPVLRGLANPHVTRLLQESLHADLLEKLATYLHDKGFGQEVTAALVKEVVLAAWRKAATGATTEVDTRQLYAQVAAALGTREVLEFAPELVTVARYGMIASGFANASVDLLVRMHEPSRLIPIDFNPAELVRYIKVLILPTGSLYGLDTADSFKARLEEYVRLGGTVICMAQQHGYDFSALPGGIKGYGWAEDQSCHARSVVITRSHPIFAGQDSVEMDVSIDGFFTEWPEDAQVLLRRRVNGQPALLTYRYGAGRVVVMAAYADWGVSHNQLTRDERLLMRDLLTWARLGDQEVPEFDPDKLPFRLTFPITNRSTVLATQLVFDTVDPDRKISQARISLPLEIPPGETREVTLETSDLKALGHWTLDACLKSASGEELDVQRDAFIFLVNNFADSLDGVGYKSDPISFSAVTDEEHRLEGSTARVSVLLWNYSTQARTLTVKTDVSRKDAEVRTIKVPAGRRSEAVYNIAITSPRAYRFWAYVFDEDGKPLGSMTKGIFGYAPGAQVKVSTDKNAYRPGEAIQMRLEYGSAIKASFTADFVVSIVDPSGTPLFDERFTEELRPGIPGERAFTFNLPMTVRYGAFKVRVEAVAADRRIGYHEVFFTPLLQGTLVGQVRDAVTGGVVPGAKVALDTQAAIDVNAETGAYSFSTTTGGHWVRATAPNYNQMRAYTVVVPERTSVIEHLYLSPLKGQVEGFVMDLISNEPIVGAKVNPGGLPSQTTNVEGAFAVDMPRGECTVSVDAPGYTDKPSVTLQLYPGRTSQVASLFLTPSLGWVEGVVRRADTGEPLVGAEVFATGESPRQVDAEGRFRLAFAAGLRQLRARAPGHAEVSLTVYIQPGRSVHIDDFYLVPTFGEVAGIVYDTVTRAPIAGAQVTAGDAPLAVTGADGRYQFQLRAQSQPIAAQAFGHSSSSLTVSVVAGKVLEGLDLGLVPKLGQVEGVVLDAGSRLPIPGARVLVQNGPVGLTSVEGAFSFTLDSQQARLTVEVPGYQSLQVTPDVFPGRSTKLAPLFLSSLRGSVVGRLVDATTGTPLSGGRIWADSGGDVRSGVDGRFGVSSAVGLSVLHAEVEGYQGLVRFQVEVQSGQATDVGDLPLASAYGIASGVLQDVGGSGLAGIKFSADVPARDAHPDATVVTGLVVEGLTGAPIAGARVWFDTNNAGFTAADGSFRLVVPAGLQRFFVEAPGYRRVDFLSRVDWGHASSLDRIELTTVRGQLTGRVLSSTTGEPLSSARVWSSTLPAEWVLTDAQGRYTLPLAEGEHTLLASAAEHVDTRGLRVDVMAGQVNQVPEMLLVPAIGWLEGTARDSVSGEPIAGVLVLPDIGDGVMTNAQGQYRLKVAPGARSVTAVAQGYRASTRISVRVAAGGAMRLDALLLAPLQGELRGSVRNALDGQPLVGARVWLGTAWDSSVVTDALGRFSLMSAAGVQRLQAEAVGMQGPVTADVFVSAGRITEASLLFLLPVGAPAPAAGVGTVTGRLMDAISGQPLAGVRVGYDVDLVDGALRQSANTYAPATAENPYPGTSALVGDSSWQDYTFSFEAKPLDDDAWGFYLRHKDAANHYRFVCANDATSGGPLRRLERVSGGVRTTLFEDRVPFAQGRWVKVEVSVRGDLFTLSFGGRLIAQVRDGANPSGRVGMFCWGQQGQLFRAIQVRDTTEATLFSESFTQGLTAWTVQDAPGASPVSQWQAVPPAGVRTDAEGHFLITGVASGVRTLYLVDEPGYATYQSDSRLATFTVQPGRTTELGVHPTPVEGTVQGLLRDAVTGQGIPGLRVWAFGRDESVTTDSTGAFQLRLPAVDTSLTAQTWSVRTNSSRYVGAEARLFEGALPPGRSSSFEARLEPMMGEVSIALAQRTGGAPLEGVEVFHGDPVLRWGGFALARAEGSREGSRIEGPALLNGQGTWQDAEVRFEALCASKSGWGALLRHKDRFNTYRLLYIAETGGPVLTLVRRQGFRDVVLGEVTRAAHDANRWYAVRFAIAGSRLTVELDGERVLEVDDVAPLTSGRVGVIGWGQAGTTLRRVEAAGTDGAVLGPDSAWVEEPGFGFNGGTATPVTGITGEAAADATSCRYGTFDYHFPLPDGEYRVELTLAENYYKLPAKRRFDIFAGPQVLEKDLDLFATGGFGVAIRRTHVVTAVRGWLRLQFRPSLDNALVSFIRVWGGAQPVEGEVPLYAVRGGATGERPLFQATTSYGVVAGGTVRTGGDVAESEGTPASVAAMLRTWREGTLTYRLHLTPGAHELQLYFAEHVATAPGQRLVDVLVDGVPRVKGLDVVSLVGRQRAYRVALPIQSTGEPTEVLVRGAVGYGMLGALAVDFPGPEGLLIDCGTPSEHDWVDARGASFKRLPVNRAVTGPDGQVRFTSLPVADYQFSALKDGWMTSSGNDALLWAPLLGGQSLPLGDRLRQRTGAVMGRVLDGMTRQPIAGAEVWYGSRAGVSMSGADGGFHLVGVPPGTHYVSVSAPGYKPLANQAQQLQVTVEAGFTLAACTLVLIPTAVTPSQPYNPAAVTRATGADGRWSLELPVGRRTVSLEGTALGAKRSIVVDVLPNRLTRLSLTPGGSGGAVLKGSLSTVGGTLPEGVEVSWSAPELGRGALRQVSNAYTGTAPGWNAYRGTHALAGDGAWTDYRFSFQSRGTDDDAWGAVFRYQDEQNYYRFFWLQDTTQGGALRRLERMKDGVLTVLADNSAPYPLNQWLDVVVQAQGDVLSVSVQGQELFRVQDSTLPSGKVGLYCWQQQNQLFRSIRVDTLAGAPLYVETFTRQLMDWTVVDSPGLISGPSRWEMVAPTGVTTTGGFQLENIPAGTQSLYVTGGGLRTGATDNLLMSVPTRAGDVWQVELPVMDGSSELLGQFVDTVTGNPVAGAQVWTDADTRQLVRTDAEGRFRLRLPTGPFARAPVEEVLYVAAAGFVLRTPYAQASLPLPFRPGATPVLRLLPDSGVLRGRVLDAVNGAPREGAEVFWGDGDLAAGSVKVSGGRWSGDPLRGLFQAPSLLTRSEDAWSDSVLSADIKASRSGGVVLLLRYQDLGQCYRAVLVRDPDGAETVIEAGVVEGTTVRFTRRGPGWTQLFTGALQGDTLSGTFTSAGSTYRFTARRRLAAGSGPVEGEWLANANGTLLRLELTGGATGFTGRGLETLLGGSVMRIERWSGGRRMVLGEVSGRGFPVNEWTALRFTASGNTLRLQSGSVVVLEVSDATPLPAGRAGLQSFYGTDVLFRSVQVTSSAGTVLFADDFPRGLARWTSGPGWGAVGGGAYSVTGTVTGDEQMLATHGRSGTDFHYVFALPPGVYRLELAFLDQTTTTVGARTFDVFVNDELVDTGLDVFALAGNKLLLRGYRVQPGVAGLVLRLLAKKGTAFLNHIRIWPEAADAVLDTPLLAVRPGTGDSDPALFALPNAWGAVGGSAYQAPAQVTVPGVPGSEQSKLLNLRQGTFTYRFRLPPGRVVAELSFAELQDATRAGIRGFDVFANGQRVFAGVDVASRVGNRLLRLRTEALEVGADGVLSLDFAPRLGTAFVNLIRCFSEDGTTLLVEADCGGATDRDWVPGVTVDSIWLAKAPQGDRTDAAGEFLIPRVVPGTQQLSVRGEGIATLVAATSTLGLPVLGGRDYTLGLNVKPTVSVLSGEVVDIVTGQPVEGAEVWFRDAPMHWRTDELGVFRIPDFPVDVREVYARAPGYVTPGSNEYVMTVQVSGGQEGRYRVFLTPSTGPVEGVLKDSITGDPIEGARVWLGTRRRAVVTGPEGRFVVKDFPAGQPLPVFAAREGYQAPGTDGNTITLRSIAGRPTRFQAFLQPTYGVVQGRVLDLITQQPVAGALVYVDAGEISTSTDALGQFRMRVPKGSHRLYVEAAGLITEGGHVPAATVTVMASKQLELTLFLKSISGLVRGQVLDSISLQPIPGALVYVDEGFANTLTDAEGRYRIAQSNKEHAVYVKAVDYAPDREDGWMATAPVEASREVGFNHLLRPTLQLVSFAIGELPAPVELLAGQEHTFTCRVRNTGRREGGATVRLVIPGFVEQENTEWLAAGAEGLFTFPFRMPTDALSAENQEVFFELVGGERRRFLVPIRGIQAKVVASLDKALYEPGEMATLRLQITNLSGGSYSLFTRAQFGETTQLSTLKTLTDTLTVEHTLPVDSSRGKLFFGVYLETGRALSLNTFYIPRADDVTAITADKQVYELGDTVSLSFALTAGGRDFFQGTGDLTGRFRVVRADDGLEIVPVWQVLVPMDAPLPVQFTLPPHLRQGTYRVEWKLTAGEKVAAGEHAVDVRGYKARFIEFLTNRREYLRTDTVKINGMLEMSHALPCRLEMKMLGGNGDVGTMTRTMEVPAGRSMFSAEVPLSTEWAGHHTLIYALTALPVEGVEVPLVSAMQGVEVSGPVVLGVNTDKRRYRPGDPMRVTVTARGRATVPLRLSWDTGEVALEATTVLTGVHSMEFALVAPASGAMRLKAEFVADTRSEMTTPVQVRA